MGKHGIYASFPSLLQHCYTIDLSGFFKRGHTGVQTSSFHRLSSFKELRGSQCWTRMGLEPPTGSMPPSPEGFRGPSELHATKPLWCHLLPRYRAPANCRAKSDGFVAASSSDAMLGLRHTVPQDLSHGACPVISNAQAGSLAQNTQRWRRGTFMRLKKALPRSSGAHTILLQGLHPKQKHGFHAAFTPPDVSQGHTASSPKSVHPHAAASQ